MRAIAILAAALPAFLTSCNHAAADPAPVQIEMPIAKDRLPPNLRRIKVRQGDQVRLLWSADEAMTVHLEGYEIVVTVLPGKPATMAFEAKITGRFPVHAHALTGSGGHGHGHRALAHIEVHPK